MSGINHVTNMTNDTVFTVTLYLITVSPTSPDERT